MGRVDRAAQALVNHDMQRSQREPPHIADMLDGDNYCEVAIKMLAAADDGGFEFPSRRSERSQRPQLRAV
jgi:hypothetical protein